MDAVPLPEADRWPLSAQRIPDDLFVEMRRENLAR